MLIVYGAIDDNNEDKIVADLTAYFNIPQKSAQNIVSKVKKCVRRKYQTDKNILLTQEVRMSLNMRQHHEMFLCTFR